MIEVESVIVDDKTYAIINEAVDGETTYVLLANPDNHDDVMIRKLMANDDDLYIPLANEEEFDLACMLLFKNSMKKND